MRYPGGGVSERFGCPLPLLAGWPDEVEEEGTCEREGRLGENVRARLR